MNRFAILAAPRTGSNLLCTFLNSHDEIVCHHELFNPSGIFTAKGYDGAELGSVAERDGDPVGFLERFWKRAPRRGAFVGFKWTRDQSELALRHLIADEGVLKIILRRRNRLKTFLSECIARRLDQWEVYDAGELVTERPRIHVHTADLFEHIDANRQFYRRVHDMLGAQPRFELDYEELLDRSTHERLLRFMGVSPLAPLRAGSIKQNSDDLRELVANLDELSVALSGTELEQELSPRAFETTRGA